MGMREYSYAIMVTCAVIVGFSMFATGLGMNYNKNVNNITTFQTLSNNTFNNISRDYLGTQTNLTATNTTAGTASGLFNAFWIFLKAGWDGIVLTLSIPIIIGNFTSDIIFAFTGVGIPGFGIPPWFVSLLSACLTIYVVTMLIKFAKGDTSDV